MTDQLTQHPQSAGRPGVDPAVPSSSVPGRPALARSLVALQAEVPRVHKDQTANVKTDKGTYSYSFADLKAVSDALRPLLAEHGLAFTAFPTLTGDGKFVLRYHLLHESGERESGEYPLPTGGTPQAIGSAITYARRYSLCAVTGLTPDDDDDAAAAEAGQAATDAALGRQDGDNGGRAAEYQSELQHAVDGVRGAWANAFGPYDVGQVADFYGRWSGGGLLRTARPAQLRKFAAYLSTMPVKDAGQDPANTPVPPPRTDAAGSDGGPEDVESGPRPLTRLQRARIFAELNSRGVKDAAEQRTYIGEVIGRPIKSRTEITLTEAKVLIDHFELLGPPPGTAGQEEGIA